VEDIPINYVYREEDAATPDARNAVYPTDEDRRKAITILSGTHYQLDNRRIWHEFKPLIIDGPGRPFITAYENQADR
jgi:hypothetical protein